MTDTPFRHHPELSKLVTPPEKSAMRDFRGEDFVSILKANGAASDWILTPEARDQERATVLPQRPTRDLWVFAYGSLMWDPAFHFIDMRRAFAPDWQRRFILRDIYGGRGTAEKPGVMAALDHGDGCHGMAFCIAEDQIDCETRILWRRERIGPAYKPRFIDLETDGEPIRALTFVADYASDIIDADLGWQDMVRYCATGHGFLGSSLEYVANLALHFDEIGIKDDDVTRLLTAARGYAG